MTFIFRLKKNIERGAKGTFKIFKTHNHTGLDIISISYKLSFERL